jgi:cell division protein FtsB
MLNVDVNQAMLLLGHRTLELELLKAQCETIAADYNAIKNENETLKARIAELEEQPRLREVK